MALIVFVLLSGLSLLALALAGSYRLGRRRRRWEVVMELMDDDVFVHDMGALDRARDQIKEMNTRYAAWERSRAVWGTPGLAGHVSVDGHEQRGDRRHGDRRTATA
jgi:hypothetical protein